MGSIVSLNSFALICFLSNLLCAYFLGRLVLKKSFPVFYSRKIIHILFYPMPLVIARTFVRSLLTGFGYSLAVMAIVKLILYMEYFRKRIPFLKYCFAALERPEERPYSLHLLAIQKFSFIIIMNLGKWMNPHFMTPFIYYMIAYMTLALGDGLAEPVGRTIKSYKYRVYSVFKTRENYRTVAGSLCVFIVPFLTILLYYPRAQPEFIYQLLLVPVIAMVLEAISPKALDAPILFFGTFFSLHMIRGWF